MDFVVEALGHFTFVVLGEALKAFIWATIFYAIFRDR